MRRYLPLLLLARGLASGVQQTTALQSPDVRYGAAVGNYPSNIAQARATARATRHIGLSGNGAGAADVLGTLWCKMPSVA